MVSYSLLSAWAYCHLVEEHSMYYVFTFFMSGFHSGPFAFLIVSNLRTIGMMMWGEKNAPQVKMLSRLLWPPGSD